MVNAQSLVSRFREVQLDGDWVALTNLKAQIEDIDIRMARTKIGSLNTILELTYHINYYIQGVSNVLEGGELNISDKFSFDVPSIETEEDWTMLKNKTFSDAERFENLVKQLSKKQLQDVFVDEKYGTVQRNVECMIEHSYYHLGQIVIIKKLILQGFVD